MFKKASESAPVDMEPKLNYMRRLSNMFRHEKRRESIDDFISQVIDKNERKEKMPATAKFTKANTVGDFAQQTGSEDFYGRDAMEAGEASSIKGAKQPKKPESSQNAPHSGFATRDSNDSHLSTSNTQNSLAASIQSTETVQDFPAIRHVLFFQKGLSSKDERTNGSITCTNYGTTSSPLWKRDVEGNVICNACRLYKVLHGKPRPFKNDDDAASLRKPSIGYVQDNGRAKRKVTPVTLLSGSRRTTDKHKQRQRAEDLQREEFTVRRRGFLQQHHDSSDTSSSGMYDSAKFDQSSDQKAQKQLASGLRRDQLATHGTSTLSGYSGISAPAADLYDQGLSSGIAVRAGMSGRGRRYKRQEAKQRHASGDREHASTSRCRRRYSGAVDQPSHHDVVQDTLGDIRNVPHLTDQKRHSLRQHQERHEETVIVNIIQQIPRAKELTQESHREDEVQEQHHYSLLRSASVGDIDLLEGGSEQKTSLLATHSYGMTHSHSICDEKLKTASQPHHGKYQIRTDSTLSGFSMRGLQKPSIRPASHATQFRESGRRYNRLGKLVYIGDEKLYIAPDRTSSKGKAGGRIVSAAPRQRAHSFEEQDGREVVDASALASQTQQQSSRLYDRGGRRAEVQSISSNSGMAPYPPSMESDEEPLPRNIPISRGPAFGRASKWASGGRRRAAPEPLSSGHKLPSRADHEQAEDRSSSFLRRAAVNTADLMDRQVPRTPPSPSLGRKARTLGDNSYPGPTPYNKLLDRAITPRSKSSSLQPSMKTWTPAVACVTHRSAPSITFLRDTLAPDVTPGGGSARSWRRRGPRKVLESPLQFDPRNSVEVENFLIESITPIAERTAPEDVSNYCKGSARSTSSKLTDEEVEAMLIDTLFAMDKPKSPFVAPSLPVTETSLHSTRDRESTLNRPRRKSMLSKQLSPVGNDQDGSCANEELSNDRERDSWQTTADDASAPSLPFQMKHEQSSKMTQAAQSIRLVDSFHTSAEIKSRGTTISPPTSTAMKPSHADYSRCKIWPLAVHHLNTPLNDPSSPEQLDDTISLLEAVQIMDERAHLVDVPVPTTHPSLRQRVSSGLTRTMRKMKIKVEKKGESALVRESKRDDGREEKPRKLSKQRKGEENLSMTSGVLIKQEDAEEPFKLKRSSLMWSRMATRRNKAPMGFDGANEEYGGYRRAGPTMGYDGANDYDDSRSPGWSAENHRAEDTYNEYDDYAESEPLGDFISSDEDTDVEDEHCDPNLSDGWWPSDNLETPAVDSGIPIADLFRPAASASQTALRSAGDPRRSAPTASSKAIVTERTQAEISQHFPEPVMKIEPEMSSSIAAPSYTPRIKAEEPSSAVTVATPFTRRTNKPEKEISSSERNAKELLQSCSKNRPIDRRVSPGRISSTTREKAQRPSSKNRKMSQSVTPRDNNKI